MKICGQLRKQTCETPFLLLKLVLLIIMFIINDYLNHCEVVPLDLYHHHLLDCNFLQVHRTTFLYVLQWPNMINTYIKIKKLNIYMITIIKYLPFLHYFSSSLPCIWGWPPVLNFNLTNLPHFCLYQLTSPQITLLHPLSSFWSFLSFFSSSIHFLYYSQCLCLFTF